MKHLYLEKDRNQPTLLLLHGTGGDEQSLVEIGNFLAPTSSLLGIRGNVNEDGANRYFRRFSEGLFDLESLSKESARLLAEIADLTAKYQLAMDELIVLGYSNGANIGAHLMLERENSLKQGILLHPMSLGQHHQTFPLTDQRVWLSYGYQDPIVPEATFTNLVNVFERRGAETTAYRGQMSHGVTQAELVAAKKWLEERR